MTKASEAFDISLFWMAGPDKPDRTCLQWPDTTACASFSDALDKAKSSSPDATARPWIEADGVLFGPAQIEVLCRLTGLHA
ncbi:hypothetical protein HCU64_02240 [Methylobacterium sp. C25]|uniref:hypothetical protein n=1 Tax=Methylobacterium sp. C25 TaxID=2721622 RepID=UPI001F188E4D|nr:hypothetical protein [Methylobacterium sp. C25]MCE4222560.1 hypothetical protein [Methylobacterium sp. C25]